MGPELVSITNLRTERIGYPEIARRETKHYIWEKLLACAIPNAPFEEVVEVDPFPYVDLFNPEREDVVTFTIVSGNVEGKQSIAVIMEYYGRKVDDDGDGQRRVRFFPKGDPGLYLPELRRIAREEIGKPSREFRLVLPKPPFDEPDLYDLFNCGWTLKQYENAKNPQEIIRMSRHNNEGDKLTKWLLPEDFLLRDLIPEDEVGQNALLMHYPRNSFRHESLFRNDHLVILDVKTGQIVCSAGIIAKAWPVYIVGDLVTHPDFRKMGLATALVYELIKRKVPKGATIVADANGISHKVFEMNGFMEKSRSLWSVHENPRFLNK